LAAGFCLLAAIGFGLASRRRARLWVGLAVGAAIATLAGLAGSFDLFLPATTQRNLTIAIEPVESVELEVIVGAHYDTKTEPLDHVARTLWFGFAAGAALIATVRASSRCGGRWCAVAALAAIGCALQLATGRWLAPSHGIVDNGAACALLAELAARQQPLPHTRVVFAWWAGEEQGAQGSSAQARALGDRPRAVINLECIGAGPEVGVVAVELAALLPRRADSRLRRVAADAGANRVLRFPAVTDAGSFLARDIPAVTLIGLPARRGVQRGLHSGRDRIDALDRRGVQQARLILLRMLRGLDATVEPRTPAPVGRLRHRNRPAILPAVRDDGESHAGETRCRAKPSRSPITAPAVATKSRS
jgi:hypothetical protein